MINMKIISKVKCIVLAVFLVLGVSTNMYSAQKTSKNYTYIQINQMNNINSVVKDVSWIPDVDTGVLKQTNAEFTFRFFDPIFMSNLIVGFMWGGNYGVELEYASYDMFIDKVDGELAGNNQSSLSNIRIEYVFLNFRQDFLEYKDINLFYKLGYGFLQPNFASSGATGGPELEIAIQGSLGGYYAFNDFLDLEISYKILGNYAQRRDLYAYGYEKKTQFIESSINWGLRFKLHSYSKKDVSFY